MLYEKNVSEDLREKAVRLQLPPNFYSYLNAPACPGCEGCDPEDRLQNNNPSTSTINTITQSNMRNMVGILFISLILQFNLNFSLIQFILLCFLIVQFNCTSTEGSVQ